MSDNLQADTPVSRARARLMSVVSILISFFKFAGLFFVGIMAGAGIVLRNPPEDKAAKKKIVELMAENDSLKVKSVDIKTINQPSDKLIEKETIVIN